MPKTKKVIIEEVEEIFEEDIIQEQDEQVFEESRMEQPVMERRELTPAEQKEIMLLREQKRKRYAQLAGLADEDGSHEVKESHRKEVKSSKIKLSMLSEGLRQKVKQIMKEGKTKMSQFPDDIKKMISEEMESMPMVKEFGMPAHKSDSHPYSELDGFAAGLAVSVENAIIKHLGLASEDPDMPNKANYIVDKLTDRLKNPF